MRNIPKGEIPKIYVMGDIHGKYQPVRDFWLRAKEKQKMTRSRENQVIILLGDAGLNYFFNHRDKELKTQLGKYPFTYFVVRGNHEERPSNCMVKEPDKWDIEKFWDGMVYVEKEFPYIKYADDGPAIYNIPYIVTPCELRDDNENGDIEWNDLADYYKTLVLPGAYSVDKFYRLQRGYSWFEDEQMSLPEREYAWDLIGRNGHEFDLILSHTCPICFEPTDLFLPMVDQAMVDKDMERFMGAVEYATDYTAWMWGHYHGYRDYPRTDGKKKLMLFHEAIELNQYMSNDIVEVL